MRKFIYLFLGFSIFAFNGCQTTIIEPPIYPDFSTPAKTLESLEYVYTVSHNMDDYKNLFYAPNYHHYFGTDPSHECFKSHFPTDGDWDWQQEIDNTEQLFESAYDLSLEFLNLDQYDYDYPGEDCRIYDVETQIFYWPSGPEFAYFSTGPNDFYFIKIRGQWTINAWYTH